MVKLSHKSVSTRLTFHPVTKERLADLSRFSQQHGKFRYCSCMRWRLRSSEFQRSTPQQRVAMLEQLARTDVPIGILAYADKVPIGWCSIAPRDTYTALLRSRTLPPLDDTPVWSVVCFFVDRKFRRQNLSFVLLKAAVDYALSQSAPAVEGYPVPTDAPSYTFMGTLSTFLKAGFRDVTPSGQTRTVMRYVSAEKGLDKKK